MSTFRTFCVEESVRLLQLETLWRTTVYNGTNLGFTEFPVKGFVEKTCFKLC